MEHEFINYEIMKYLKDHDSYYYNKITELYQVCRNLLTEIPKTFSNYTLHDIGHSVRVIGYMNDFVKDRLEEFSSLHLALIVYAGLLHDTGMAVSDDEKNRLYTQFEMKNSKFKSYSDEEKIQYLQNYIRKNHGRRVSAVLDQEMSQGMSIKGCFYEGETKSYDLSQVVADICQSHTEDCKWIVKNLDCNLYYGRYKINPQHIACLLRIGDALDIDDRRAPYVLYKFLNPRGYSGYEWRKHIPITNYKKISSSGSLFKITFSGACSEPEIYRKVLEYIDWIDSDLKNTAAICKDFEESYQLNISHPVKVRIKTIGFVETPLRFSLEYKQISKLLMGERIYGNKKDGLRELLQNAIDAVLLMKDIEEKNPYSSYMPTVGIEIKEKERQFIVFDNGTGMSEDILGKYFFNIGKSYYISDEFNEGEHIYKPIGHFGIGFLACFMLSSQITLETQYYKSAEFIRMSFDKESPYVTKFESSGEDFLLNHGTRIVMNYDQMVPDVFESEESITAYIKDLLITDEYEFIVINHDKKRIFTQKPRKICIEGDGVTEFEYTLASPVSVKFDILDFFKNNEDVYLVDSRFYDFINLGYLIEAVEDIEILVQSEEAELEDIVSDTIYSDIIYELAEGDLQKLTACYKKSGSFYGILYDYLYGYVRENSLQWYDIPVIVHKNTFNSFLDVIEHEGLERALHEYRSDVQYASIMIRRDEELSDDLILDIADNFISDHDNGNDITEVDYYSSYPVAPIEKHIGLFGFPKSNSYIRIMKDYKSFISAIYLKGIKIRDESIVIPDMIKGLEIMKIYFNIKSNCYKTDISRNNFDSESKKRLVNRMVRLIYEDIMSQKKLDGEERKLVRFFLDTYYELDYGPAD